MGDWISTMNEYGRREIPFLFILDFELQKPVVIPLADMPDDILYKLSDVKNYELHGTKSKPLIFNPIPVNYDTYSKAFEGVLKEILLGNSFLLNLTFPTKVESNYTLRSLFDISRAKYKLYFKDQFIVSSPEIFVQIKDGKISTFPMKGTIDAEVPDAENVILADKKETAEHYTIVDLLRNDLSIVAKNVRVNRFRYIEKLTTTSRTLLQVSSEIEGTLPDNYKSKLGDIFAALLPAGSISGAPKKKTVQIIKDHEIDARGYYTGVFGVFDGQNVDSAVMIRFIENTDGNLTYRSGCGITALSDCEAEYKEMIAKVYVPVGRKY
jgi:para-aminobenzoate synthetase component 1